MILLYNMAPAWIELAEQNENESIVVGDIDVTANEIGKISCNGLNVKSFLKNSKITKIWWKAFQLYFFSKMGKKMSQ